ncbi:MAG: DNA-binding protein [Bacteriovoracaceae bacterium]|nr:DNA-binding protein [Bacteriovoracaceae bacterium]
MGRFIFLILILPFLISWTALGAEVLPMKSTVEAHILRLGPGEDPKTTLIKYVQEKKIQAASIASAVGSLSVTFLRYANKNDFVKIEGFREVVSLSGTLGASSGVHLHLSISDDKGATLGGHLADGSKVYTTLEIVLLAYPELEFSREVDPKTTFKELSIKKSSK